MLTWIRAAGNEHGKSARLSYISYTVTTALSIRRVTIAHQKVLLTSLGEGMCLSTVATPHLGTHCNPNEVAYIKREEMVGVREFIARSADD